MPSPTDAAVALSPKFGDWMRGIYASEKNPLRDGMFVRTIRRTGRCNPGTYYELTDGKGRFWQYPRESAVMLDGSTRAQAPAAGDAVDSFCQAMQSARGYLPLRTSSGALQNLEDINRFDGWCLAMTAGLAGGGG